ncbi:MAG: hypothetical protein IPK13_16520 [Deltaproteobacteria bacterium]|nr:hypothetical protein [Deltaproteobacteria bacterium]
MTASLVPIVVAIAIAHGSLLVSCASSEEAPQVSLPVAVDASGLPTVTNDLGYSVELQEARLMVKDLTFAIAGEAHASSRPLWQRLADGLIARAYAHPGHYQAGDVTGELRGRFLLSWLRDGSPPTDPEPTTLGQAMLLAGAYKSANFVFAEAMESDGVSADDPLLGHTAILRRLATPTTIGSTTTPSRPIPFVALIDAPKDRAVIGIPFVFDVGPKTTAQLEVRLLLTDPEEGDTLFDGIDFSTIIPEDDDGEPDGSLQGDSDPRTVVLSADASTAAISDAYNRLRRTFQTHDHFEVQASPSPASAPPARTGN